MTVFLYWLYVKFWHQGGRKKIRDTVFFLNVACLVLSLALVGVEKSQTQSQKLFLSTIDGIQVPFHMRKIQIKLKNKILVSVLGFYIDCHSNNSDFVSSLRSSADSMSSDRSAHFLFLT